MRKQKLIISIMVLFGLLFAIQLPLKASVLEGNPHITWAPDGQAFTTDAGEKEWISHEIGYEVITGTESTMRALR